MIYVRSKDGKALMPSERGGRIGWLSSSPRQGSCSQPCSVCRSVGL